MKRNVLLLFAWMTFVISFAQTPTEGHVNFFKGQVATIILPTMPDADKGKYFRIDRWEEGRIAFEQELHPQAHTPYIIVPNENFSIDPNNLDLDDLRPDTATIEGVYFIGWYINRDCDLTMGRRDLFLDTTPDCYIKQEPYGIHVGPLRASFRILWRFCSTWERLEYVLHSTGGADSMNALESDSQMGTRKVIRDKRLYIIRDGETYSVDGKRIK